MPSKSAKADTAKTKQHEAKVLSTRVVYRGPVFHVTSARVREPHGIEVRRDIVRHQGSVVVMAVEDMGAGERDVSARPRERPARAVAAERRRSLLRNEPRVLLARQYRYAAGRPLWELPAGRIDPGEDALTGAKRELMEETGFTAKHWKLALKFWVSPGFLDETMAVYLAAGLTRGRAHPEEDEVISKRFFPLSAAVRMAMTGKIKDAKTIAGVLWLAQHCAALRASPER